MAIPDLSGELCADPNRKAGFRFAKEITANDSTAANANDSGA